MVSYTFTIESTGGNGIVVPGYGFLLNNELTDFNYDSLTHPNRADGGKRPRSSMAPTIIEKRRPAVPRARLAGRLDDPGHGDADDRQPDRPAASRCPTRSRCRARSSATRRPRRPSRRSSTPGRPELATVRGHRSRRPPRRVRSVPPPRSSSAAAQSSPPPSRSGRGGGSAAGRQPASRPRPRDGPIRSLGAPNRIDPSRRTLGA